MLRFGRSSVVQGVTYLPGRQPCAVRSELLHHHCRTIPVSTAVRSFRPLLRTPVFPSGVQPDITLRMGGVAEISGLRQLLASQGVRTAYVKLLSPKQDNDKNQIYFGKKLPGLQNIFPARLAARGPSSSSAKRSSRAGQPKLEARLDFAWLDQAGVRHDAPGTRIIDYFQYPEVRMSGFLKGCDAPPDALRRHRQALYGQRILVMGTASDGKVVGLVLTARDDPLVTKFPDLRDRRSRTETGMRAVRRAVAMRSCIG